MPGLHWYDLLVLVGVALLIFGPKRLPEMGSAVGKTIKEFQKSIREVTDGSNHTTPTPAPTLPQAIETKQLAASSSATPVETHAE